MAIKERWKHTRPLALSTDEAITKAIEIFSSHIEVECAYLFGSHASGLACADSDIDFAFHAAKSFLWEDYYTLYGLFSKAFRTDRFDLVWLDKSPPDVVFDIIKFGRVIYHCNADKLNDFELYAKKRFWEYKNYLNSRARNG